MLGWLHDRVIDSNYSYHEREVSYYTIEVDCILHFFIRQGRWDSQHQLGDLPETVIGYEEGESMGPIGEDGVGSGADSGGYTVDYGVYMYPGTAGGGVCCL